MSTSPEKFRAFRGCKVLEYMLGSVGPPADGVTHFLTSGRGFLLGKTAPAAHDLGGSVDDVNPALPIITNRPTIPIL